MRKIYRKSKGADENRGAGGVLDRIQGGFKTESSRMSGADKHPLRNTRFLFYFTRHDYLSRDINRTQTQFTGGGTFHIAIALGRLKGIFNPHFTYISVESSSFPVGNDCQNI